jgi:hypothetical protein
MTWCQGIIVLLLLNLIAQIVSWILITRRNF